MRKQFFIIFLSLLVSFSYCFAASPSFITITSPSEGSYISKNITIEVELNQIPKAKSVKFYIDNTLIGEDTSYPYQYSWDTTSYPDGQHQIYASLFQGAEHVPENVNPPVLLNSPKINVIVDNTAPQIVITFPQNGSISNIQTISISGTIDDNQATLTVNGSPVTISNGAFTVNNITLTQGQNAITAAAIDLAGNASSASITVTYQPNNSGDTTPPNVRISVPDKDSTTRSAIIYGEVSDDTVRVAVNGIDVQLSDSTFLARPALTEGQNTVTIKAWDVSGNLGQSQISFIYNTATPKVTITSPIDNSVINVSPIKVEGITSSDLNYLIVKKDTSTPVIEGKFSAQNVQLNRGLTVITVEGRDKDDKVYEDSIIITSPELSDYQIVSGTESAGEFDESRPVAGSTIPLKITLYKNNQPAPNNEIQFKVTEGNGVLSQENANTDANGDAQVNLTTDINTANGNKVECFVSANPLVKTSFYFHTKPNSPSMLTKVSDDSISPVPGATVDLVVKLTDVNNNPIPNETINFQITQGMGTLSSLTARTTSYGEARVTLRTTLNANESTQITTSCVLDPTLSASFNITTSQAVNLTFDQIMAKVNENGNKVQDFSADVIKISDEPGAAPQERYKIWKKGDKTKIQLLHPEQRSYIIERTENSINLNGTPFLTVEDQGSATMTTTDSIESFSGNIFVLKRLSIYPNFQQNTKIYVDCSKGIITHVCSEYSSEVGKDKFEEERSYILVDGIWLPNKIIKKTGSLIDGSVYTTTENFSNVIVNSGIPDSVFQ